MSCCSDVGLTGTGPGGRGGGGGGVMRDGGVGELAGGVSGG